MSKKTELLELIASQGMLPLYFNADEETSIGILRALYKAGIRTVEYTNRGEEALHNFTRMKEVCRFDMPDMFLGIGTIKDAGAARAFILAGADYIICPGLIEEVADAADEHDVLWIPGCMTPSEIIKAEQMGARLVKLFPGNILGPGYMAAIRDLFPGLRFMPTGGVEANRDSVGAWFQAGVSAVGMGSKLISAGIMDERRYEELEISTKAALDIIRTVRARQS